MKFNNAQTTILDFFKQSRVRSTKSVWEKIDDGDGWKWVLSLHNLNWGDTIVSYTKFILKTNYEKTELIKQQFSYLYDINCKYRFINFSDQSDLIKKLESIIFNNAFGEDTKNISMFLENPTLLLNDKLAQENITDFTIFDLNYEPRYTILPCKLISFDFKFDINNLYQIDLNIKKDNNSEYKFRFQLKDDTKIVETHDLNNIEGVIIQYIKTLTKQK